MKCKCKTEMIHLGDRKRETDFDSDSYEIYWCEKCGRAVEAGSNNFSSWYEHKGLPKPKIVAIPLNEWCKCDEWKNHNKGLTCVNSMKHCPFCGKEITRVKSVIK